MIAAMGKALAAVLGMVSFIVVVPVAHADTDSAVLRELNSDGIHVDVDPVALAHATCTTIDQKSVPFALDAIHRTEPGLSDYQVTEFVAVSIANYCPWDKP